MPAGAARAPADPFWSNVVMTFWDTPCPLRYRMSSALNVYDAPEFLMYAKMTSSPRWAWASFTTSCNAGDKFAGGAASLLNALLAFQKIPAMEMQTTAETTVTFLFDSLVVFMCCILLRLSLAFSFKIYKHRDSTMVSSVAHRTGLSRSQLLRAMTEKRYSKIGALLRLRTRRMASQ